MNNINEGLNNSLSALKKVDLSKIKMGLEYEFKTDSLLSTRDKTILSHVRGKTTEVDMSVTEIINDESETILEFNEGDYCLVVKDGQIVDFYRIIETSAIEANLLDAYEVSGIYSREQISSFLEFIDEVEIDDLDEEDVVDQFFADYLEQFDEAIFNELDFYKTKSTKAATKLQVPFQGALENIGEQLSDFIDGEDTDDRKLYINLYHIKNKTTSIRDEFNTPLKLQFDFIQHLIVYGKYKVYKAQSEKPSIQDVLEQNNLAYSDLQLEHDDQYEIVTPVLSVEDAFRHVEVMFNAMSEHGYETFEKSGLHVSISSSEHKNNPLNFFKHIMLMDMDTDFMRSQYLIPNSDGNMVSREHTADVGKRIEKRLIGFLNKIKDTKLDELRKLPNAKTVLLSTLLDRMEKVAWDDKKHYKLAYHDMQNNGRVEFRMIGSTDYHKDIENVHRHMVRAIVSLNMAYDNSYNGEYLKAFHKLVVRVLKNEFNTDIEGFLNDTNND